LIQANVTHNQDHIKSEFAIKALDFLDLSWSPDLESSVEEADIILAADGSQCTKIFEIMIYDTPYANQLPFTPHFDVI